MAKTSSKIIPQSAGYPNLFHSPPNERGSGYQIIQPLLPKAVKRGHQPDAGESSTEIRMSTAQAANGSSQVEIGLHGILALG